MLPRQQQQQQQQHLKHSRLLTCSPTQLQRRQILGVTTDPQALDMLTTCDRLREVMVYAL